MLWEHRDDASRQLGPEKSREMIVGATARSLYPEDAEASHMMGRCRRLCLVAALVLGGCAGQPAGTEITASPSLLMSTPALLDAQEERGEGGYAWESFRNGSFRTRDASWIPDYQDRLFFQARYQERLRTTNGRPREQSTYRSFAISERIR